MSYLWVSMGCRCQSLVRSFSRSGLLSWPAILACIGSTNSFSSTYLEWSRTEIWRKWNTQRDYSMTNQLAERFLGFQTWIYLCKHIDTQ